MRILSVAYPFSQIGPDAAGGSEQILSMLDRALTQAGHQSLVIAAQGSKVEGTLIASARADGTLDERKRREGQLEHARLISRVLEQQPVDLVHMHSLDFHAYLPPAPVRVLATLHLPPDWYPNWIFELQRPNFYLNCVSAMERSACPPCARLVPTIPNGVPIGSFEWRAPRANYALALGRICPEKGFHFAVEAARLANTELLLAGELFPYDAHRRYFETELSPRFDQMRRFVGPANLARKRDLLARARCLLISSTVAETSSLVAMEALASGTPVIAFPSGALPEIVEDGKTGFLVASTEDMARAIVAADSIKPEVCRAAAESRFSSTDMCEKYLALYRRFADSREQPVASSVSDDVRPATPAGDP